MDLIKRKSPLESFSLMEGNQYLNLFYSHFSRYFNGFHCRFRDIARGGLRIVTPPNSDTKSFESGRHFDEVYGLSYGQQLKNKVVFGRKLFNCHVGYS